MPDKAAEAMHDRGVILLPIAREPTQPEASRSQSIHSRADAGAFHPGIVVERGKERTIFGIPNKLGQGGQFCYPLCYPKTELPVTRPHISLILLVSPSGFEPETY